MTEKQTRAYWISHNEHLKCTNCETIFYVPFCGSTTPEYRYCPYCGAVMDGKKDLRNGV